jgi:hypothetical protein
MPTVEESDEEGRRAGHRDIGGDALCCCKAITALPLLDLIIIPAAAAAPDWHGEVEFNQYLFWKPPFVQDLHVLCDQNHE